MRIEIKFTDYEARIAHHYLKTRYKSKASFEKLAKLAIRTEVAAQARVELDKMDADRAAERSSTDGK